MTTAQATVRGRWFPADLVLPTPSPPWGSRYPHRCYVIATTTTLHIWQKTSETADWEAPITWDTTTLPTVDRDARNGFDVTTTAGLVVVTLGSGCRCGNLGRWSGPAWSQTERSR